MWTRSVQDRYSQLLAIIILLFLFTPNLKGIIGEILVSAVFLGTIIAIIRTFNLNKRFFFLLLMLAGASFTLDIYADFREDVEQVKLLELIIQTIYSLFVLAALVTINRKIFTEKRVSADTIKGGISVFFLIGVVWGFLYSIVYILNPDSFSYSGETLEVLNSLDSMFYFSFTTLTTLGYGDITPASNLARTLTNLEAIVGMMYPSVFIARLVGLYTAQEIRDSD